MVRHFSYSFLTFTLFSIVLGSVPGDNSGASIEGPLRLADILPDGYDKTALPSKPTIVNVHVVLLSLSDVDEKKKTFSADIFLRQSWKDPRIRMQNASNLFPGRKLLPLEWMEQLWRPTTFFRNARSVVIQSFLTPNHHLWLNPDSLLLTYEAKLSLVLNCFDMDYWKYPHDTQTCRIELEGPPSMPEEMASHLVWAESLPFDAGDAQNVETPPQFRLKSLERGRRDADFSCLSLSVTLSRRTSAFYAYFPASLAVVVTWIGLWIGPDETVARVLLGATGLVIAFMQQVYGGQRDLPSGAKYGKAIDVYMYGCAILAFLYLAVVTLVSAVRRKEERDVEEEQEEKEEKEEEWREMTMPQKSRQNKLADSIDQKSRYLLPAISFLFFSLYLMVYTN